MEIIEMLGTRMRQNDWSRWRLAKEIGMTEASVYAIFNGKRNISFGVARKLVKYFKTQNDAEALETIKYYILSKAGF